MALGQVGLGFDYFYSLTPRVFNNVIEGYDRKSKADVELYLFGVRRIAYASLLPYVSKSSVLRERDILELPSERGKEDEEEVDLGAVAEQVEKDKEFWEKVDKSKQKEKWL